MQPVLDRLALRARYQSGRNPSREFLDILREQVRRRRDPQLEQLYEEQFAGSAPSSLEVSSASSSGSSSEERATNQRLQQLASAEAENFWSSSVDSPEPPLPTLQLFSDQEPRMASKDKPELSREESAQDRRIRELEETLKRVQLEVLAEKERV